MKTVSINHNTYRNVALTIFEDEDTFCIDGELGSNKGIYEERSISTSFIDTDELIKWFNSPAGVKWIERKAYLI